MVEARNGEVSIHYIDEGAGVPTVLLHGHTLDHRVWDAVSPILIENGLRVIRPDLRGHGSSTRPSSGYHVSHHAADVGSVLEAAEVEAANVVGFSFGGGVALDLAIERPERVRSLTLVAPVMPDRPFEPAFFESLRQVARVTRSEGIGAAMAGPWLESPLFAVSLTKPGVRERVFTIVQDFPGAEFLATERDRVDRDWVVPERLSEIRAATLVVVGGEEMDGFKGFAAEAADGVPDARLEEVPGCGHLLPLEAPERLAELLLGHMSG